MQQHHVSKQAFFRLPPITMITAAVLLILGFFVFKMGGSSPTGALTLENTTLISTFIVTKDISIPIDDTTVQLNSAEPILIKTEGREMNITGDIRLEHVEGRVLWDGEYIVLEGTLQSAHGSGIDITWTRRERTQITLTSGVVDVTNSSMASLEEPATGRITLEEKWTAELNETPLNMNDFKGRIYLQRINNATTLGFEGIAATLNIKEKNLLKVFN